MRYDNGTLDYILGVSADTVKCAGLPGPRYEISAISRLVVYKSHFPVSTLDF